MGRHKFLCAPLYSNRCSYNFIKQFSSKYVCVFPHTSDRRWFRPGCFQERRTQGCCRPRPSHPLKTCLQRRSRCCSPWAPQGPHLDSICLGGGNEGEEQLNVTWYKVALFLKCCGKSTCYCCDYFCQGYYQNSTALHASIPSTDNTYQSYFCCLRR